MGGDFLLARASVALSRLRNLEVVELLSTVIEHLVKGEVMQMRPSPSDTSPLETYLRKNFYKTASLMAHSCLASAVLGGCNEEIQRACYLYGAYVGQAFQLIDDSLDFEGNYALSYIFSFSIPIHTLIYLCFYINKSGSIMSLGKAPLADLKSGIATAPTLFAAQEFPRLTTLINRKFESPGDIDEALILVQQSNGLQRCKLLAQAHAEKALEAINILPPSIAKDCLIALACKVVTRSH